MNPEKPYGLYISHPDSAIRKQASSRQLTVAWREIIQKASDDEHLDPSKGPQALPVPEQLGLPNATPSELVQFILVIKKNGRMSQIVVNTCQICGWICSKPNMKICTVCSPRTKTLANCMKKTQVEEYGTCCFCGEQCNASSQSCGRCIRNT